jgi:parallel beta-helix repeat protein
MNLYGSPGGTPEAPIRFVAEPGVVLTHSAIDSGLHNDDLAGINVENTGGWIVIQGFHVVSDGSMVRAGIRVAYSSNTQILDNTVDGAFIGIFTSNSDNLLVQGNTCLNSYGQHGIYMSLNERNCVVRGNTLAGNNWDGLHMNALDGSPNDGALVEDNVIYDNTLSGMDIEGVTNALFRNNLIYRNAKHGITLHSADQADTPPTAGNTFVGNTVARNGRFAVQLQAVDTGNTFHNNVLASSSNIYGSIGTAGFPAGLDSDSNTVVDSFSTDLGVSKLTLPQWNEISGQDTHSFFDLTPPSFDQISATTDLGIKASISWKTDEPADARVEYGTDANYGNSSPLDEHLGTDHAVALTGLTPWTTYHYRVISSDTSDNSATSEDFTFTTGPADDEPPYFWNAQVSNLTLTTATVTWVTDEPADTQIEFGTTDAYGSSVPLDPTLTNDHTVSLQGLAPATLYHYRLRSRDESGNLALSDDFTFSTNSPGSGPFTIFGFAVPLHVNDEDARPTEVGVKFRSDIAGLVSAIRFYKGPLNIGTHVGHLWDASGNLLATVTFTHETAQGWQEAQFSDPVSIEANTVYVASYSAPTGQYAEDDGYFTENAQDDPGPLHALVSGIDGPNGVSADACGKFPTEPFLSANYWVDVVLSLPPALPWPTTLSATTQSTTSVHLAWKDRSSNEDGFVVERSADGTTWQTLVVLPADANQFDDDTCTSATTYLYRVHAYNALEQSDFTGVAAATTRAGGTGLLGDYFTLPDFAGDGISRVDPLIDFNWSTVLPADGMPRQAYSIRWSGTIQPFETGIYTFYTTADDGVRLWVNGELIIDHWTNVTTPGDTNADGVVDNTDFKTLYTNYGRAGGWAEGDFDGDGRVGFQDFQTLERALGTSTAPVTSAGMIFLEARGQYDIRVDYYQATGPASIKLEWLTPSLISQVVPQDQLFPPLPPTPTLKAPGAARPLSKTLFSATPIPAPRRRLPRPELPVADPIPPKAKAPSPKVAHAPNRHY